MTGSPSLPRVAYLGPQGTFTEEAAQAFFAQGFEGIPCQDINEVFKAAAQENLQNPLCGGKEAIANYGVVPLENSTEGSVGQTLDLFVTSPLHMVGEVCLPIVHHLLRQTSTWEGIKAVQAHPQALAQCANWLKQNLPHAEQRAAYSNAKGAELASQDPCVVAIASASAARHFGLHSLAAGIQDDPHNRTRFGLLCLPSQQPLPESTGHDRTTLVLGMPNRPGALHDLLVPLKTHQVSMTRFESRPARAGEQWEYFFHLDLAGHPNDPNVAPALAELKKICTFYKLVGAYPLPQNTGHNNSTECKACPD